MISTPHAVTSKSPVLLWPLNWYNCDHLMASYRPGPITDASATAFATSTAIYSSAFHSHHALGAFFGIGEPPPVRLTKQIAFLVEADVTTPSHNFTTFRSFYDLPAVRFCQSPPSSPSTWHPLSITTNDSPHLAVIGIFQWWALTATSGPFAHVCICMMCLHPPSPRPCLPARPDPSVNRPSWPSCPSCPSAWLDSVDSV